MTDNEFEQFLQSALRRRPSQGEADAGRVLNRLAGPLPRQHKPLWQWPTVLLDWQFAPAWPRVAALASCLAIGFVIGISGLDRTIDHAGMSNDSGSLFFEPETITGAQP